MKLGYREDVHFVYNRRPPKHWIKPIQPIISLEDTISICNGTTFKHSSLASEDRGDNVDGIIGDEVLTWNRDRYDKGIKKANRGNMGKWEDAWFHHGEFLLTSMPYQNARWTREHATIMSLISRLYDARWQTCSSSVLRLKALRNVFIITSKPKNSNALCVGISLKLGSTTAKSTSSITLRTLACSTYWMNTKQPWSLYSWWRYSITFRIRLRAAFTRSSITTYTAIATSLTSLTCVRSTTTTSAWLTQIAAWIAMWSLLSPCA